MIVSVLFARRDSVYKAIDPGCQLDVYDEDRDARTWTGGTPVVAHPPCRGWGRFRNLSQHTIEEKGLAVQAVVWVREWGGVLEHPQASSLWDTCGLPRPGQDYDHFGGFTLDVDQYWWGHRAQKRTWLYVCGCERCEVPAMPLKLGDAPRVVTNVHGLRSGMPGYRPEITKRERESTPEAFAYWLVKLATRTGRYWREV